MTPELIISLVSLGLSTMCSMLTVFVTLKVGKLNNLEAIYKYQKKITIFELQFKTKEWFLNLINSDEFSHYDENSQAIMKAWWKKINEKESNNKQIKTTVRAGKSSKGNISRATTLPIANTDIPSTSIPVEVIIPNKEDTTNLESLRRLREQYCVEEDVRNLETKSTNLTTIDLTFDDLLDVILKEKEDQ